MKRRVGICLLSLMTAASGMFELPANAQVFINEAFEEVSYPTFLVNLGDGSQEIIEEGVGVGGSRGVRIVGDFPDEQNYLLGFLYFNALVSGNTNTSLSDYWISFDIQVNKPNVTVTVALTGTPGPEFSGNQSDNLNAAVYCVSPGTFQRVSINLADFQAGTSLEPFSPTNQSYMIGFFMQPTGWGAYTFDNEMIVDNLQVAIIPEPSVGLLLVCSGTVAGLTRTRRQR